MRAHRRSKMEAIVPMPGPKATCPKVLVCPCSEKTVVL